MLEPVRARKGRAEGRAESMDQGAVTRRQIVREICHLALLCDEWLQDRTMIGFEDDPWIWPIASRWSIRLPLRTRSPEKSCSFPSSLGVINPGIRWAVRCMMVWFNLTASLQCWRVLLLTSSFCRTRGHSGLRLILRVIESLPTLFVD